MLNINNYQYNKNWNFLIITYQSSTNGHHQEQKKITTNVGVYVGKWD